MTLSMTNSFAPSLPSLPSYPRQFSPSLDPSSSSPRSASPAPTKKRFAPASSSSSSHPSYAPSYAPTSFHNANADDSDSDLMATSFYSDRDYRSSLISSSSNSQSRKRGLDTDSEALDDFGYPLRDRQPEARPSGGGGKRRILDVVGSTVGGVLRGAWEMFKPRFPFYGSAPSPSPNPPATPPVTPADELQSMAPGVVPSFAPPRDDDDPRASPMPGQFVPSPPEPPSSTAKWVMVSPTPTTRPHSSSAASVRPQYRPPVHRRASSASTPRLIRPVKKRGVRVVAPKSPNCTLGGSPNIVGGRIAGGKADEEDEMDEDMRRFNERLKAMIREGKEALGAKVEVVYDDEDAGF